MHERLLSVAEAAKQCPHHSEVTLRRMARKGELPRILHGRRVFFRESDLTKCFGPLFHPSVRSA